MYIFHDIIENTTNKKGIFILEYLNARIEKRQGENFTGRFGEVFRNKKLKRLIKICEQAGLKV